MAYRKRSYAEHVAIRARNGDWHIRFFRDALATRIRAVDGA
jgi:hypothetical protein